MKLLNSSVIATIAVALLRNAAAVDKRAPPGVPQFIYDRCKHELQSVQVNVTAPIGRNGIRLDNVPPTCMSLAAVVVTGGLIDGPLPTVLGSASLQYNNLTAEDFEELKEIFHA